MSRKTLDLLVLEDNDDDVALVERELVHRGYTLQLRVEQDPSGLRRALETPHLDVILSDYHMPLMTALDSLAIVQDSGRDVPFIVVSGSIGEGAAVEVLTRGAADFVLKDNLARLAPAIERELREVVVRRERGDAERRLREALQARDEFLSVASHELRTPLTALQLQIDAIRHALAIQQVGDDRLRRRVEIAKRSADRLTELVDRVLDVTRLVSGRATLDVQPGVNLADVVRRVVEHLQPALQEAGCVVDVEADAGLNGTWDGERLEVVVSNLLTNALKYGAHHPIHIRLKRAGKLARLTVSDEGIGIAPEDQARIFERFERAVPQSHYGGFGVGLWQSRALIQLHGGRIFVDSSPGRGATFVVELPRGGEP